MVSLVSSFLLLCCLVLIAKGSHSSLVWLNCQLLSDFQKSHLQVPAVFLNEADCHFWFPGGTPSSDKLPASHHTALFSEPLSLNSKLRLHQAQGLSTMLDPHNVIVMVRQPACVPHVMVTPYKTQSSLWLDFCFHQLLASGLSELTSVIVGTVLPGILLQDQPTAKKAVVKQCGLGSKQSSVVLTQSRLL